MESKENPVFGALTILGLAGRNKNRQKIARVKCACGSPEFTTRLDNVKSGRGQEARVLRLRRPAPEPSPVEPAPVQAAREQVTLPAAPDAQPVQTETWYRAQIAAKEGAALVNEKRANEIEQATIELGADEELNCASGTAAPLLPRSSAPPPPSCLPIGTVSTAQQAHRPSEREP